MKSLGQRLKAQMEYIAQGAFITPDLQVSEETSVKYILALEARLRADYGDDFLIMLEEEL